MCDRHIADARAAEGLDDLDALDILHDGAVHRACGLVVSCKAVAADLERQPHAEERERERHERCKRKPPVDTRERRDADNGQHDMARALGDHVCQRRFDGLDLIDHHALDLADAVRLHIAERRAEEAVGQPQPQPLQNGIGHCVRYAGRQAEKRDLYGIGRKREQAPAQNVRRCGRSQHEQAQQLIHAVKRHEPQHDAQHRQNDRQREPLFLAAGISEQRVQPALFLRFFRSHNDSLFLCDIPTACASAPA